jgi:hypothetical protein
MMAGYRGLKGLPEAITAVWERAVVQTLSVHNSGGGTVSPATCVNGHYVLPTGGQLMCPLVASKTAR